MSRSNRYTLPTTTDTTAPPTLRVRRPTVRTAQLLRTLRDDDIEGVIALLDALVVAVEGDWNAYDGGAPASCSGAALVEVLAVEDIMGLIGFVAPAVAPTEAEGN